MDSMVLVIGLGDCVVTFNLTYFYSNFKFPASDGNYGQRKSIISLVIASIFAIKLQSRDRFGSYSQRQICCPVTNNLLEHSIPNPVSRDASIIDSAGGGWRVNSRTDFFSPEFLSEAGNLNFEEK